MIFLGKLMLTVSYIEHLPYVYMLNQASIYKYCLASTAGMFSCVDRGKYIYRIAGNFRPLYCVLSAKVKRITTGQNLA